MNMVKNKISNVRKETKKMKKIRNKAFETNSSSTHSLIVEGKDRIGYTDFPFLDIDDNEVLKIETGIYIEEYFLLKSQQEKLNFIATYLISCGRGIKSFKEELIEYLGIKKIRIDKSYGCQAENFDLEEFLNEVKIIKEDYIETEKLEEPVDLLEAVLNDDIQIEVNAVL